MLLINIIGLSGYAALLSGLSILIYAACTYIRRRTYDIGLVLLMTGLLITLTMEKIYG